MYYSGRGVERDFAEAVEWWRKAAEQGHAEAQYYLGVAHEYGYGTDLGTKQAVKWWRLAADQGNANAQRALGEAYLWGEGTNRDLVTAHMWFDLASDQENGRAKIRLDFVARILTPTERAKALKSAEAWRQAHGE